MDLDSLSLMIAEQVQDHIDYFFPDAFDGWIPTVMTSEGYDLFMWINLRVLEGLVFEEDL